MVLGYLLKLSGWSWASFSAAMHTISITSILVILLCTPVTLIASMGKGYLAPLAFVILSVVFAQIIGALGFGAYFPWAIPAIYSKMIGARSMLTLTSYLVLVITSITGFAGTWYWWSYADHTK
jgi:ABC-2 type transport system permease protein